MATLVALTSQSLDELLPALGLLNHELCVQAPNASGAARALGADAILLDGTRELSSTKSLCGVLQTLDLGIPLLLVMTEGGLPVVSPAWGVDDVVLRTAGPAEVEARLRLLHRHVPEEDDSPAGTIQVGHLVIDEQSYTARYRGRTLDLTFKEFELLRYLAAHPDHVFTRARLLSEVWGYDYYGGTRTVDVHVRRLRAKLGDSESVIGTVRNVGYRLLGEGEQRGADETTDEEPTA